MQNFGISNSLGIGEASVASAATVDLGAVRTRDVLITGTTTITSFGTTPNRDYRLRFSEALTLTHNATSLILPGGVNITTVAGDIAVIESDTSGNWRVTSFQTAPPTSAPPLVVRTISAADTVIASDKGKVLQLTGTFTLGATAAATLGSGFYCYLKKMDGVGKVTFDPNGSETIDGRTSILVYQESFLIWTNGTVWFSQGRIEGWASISRVTLTGQTLASLSITDGFVDPEISEVEINYSNLIPSTASAFSLRPLKNGSVIASPSYTIEATSAQGTSAAAPTSTTGNTSVTGQVLTPASSVNPQWGVLNARNTLSSIPNEQRLDWDARTIGGQRRGSIFDTSTTAAVSGVNIIPSSGTLVSISYTVKGFRS